MSLSTRILLPSWTLRVEQVNSCMEISFLVAYLLPGLVSRNLAQYVDRIIGVDISQGMVDEYNKNAEKAGLSGKIKAIREDLTGNGTELEGTKFDIVAVRNPTLLSLMPALTSFDP
jgi:tRNA1(Val) A37 N6-methylase TrmN6